jgi:hypothetical protein
VEAEEQKSVRASSRNFHCVVEIDAARSSATPLEMKVDETYHGHTLKIFIMAVISSSA